MSASTYPVPLSGIQETITDAKGDIIAATAADAVARLAVGANDTVLTADSSTATGIKWAAPAAGGGLTLISETVASGATTLSLSSIPSTYKQLLLEWSGIKFNSAVEQGVFTRFNNDSGSNYATLSSRSNDSAISTNRALGSDADIYLLYSNVVYTELEKMGAGWLLIDNYSSTSKFKKYQAIYAFYNGGANQVYTLNGTYKSTTAISSIDFLRTSTATWSNDTNTSIRLYGIS